MKFGLILDQRFAHHQTPAGHPERPDRIHAVSAALLALRGSTAIDLLEPVPAQEDWILGVHSRSLFQQVLETRGARFGQLDADTSTGPESFDVAMLAAGSSVRLTERILAGRLRSGFALVRPPGHHAESSRAMGFCLFNNVAVAAQWAIAYHEAERVAILDFDVHHGNGIQEIFYGRPDVLYLSQHQHPWYPGTGALEETGSGQGRGCTVNFPIQAGAGNFFYRSLFEDFVVPILNQFSPDIILISAGFDAHSDDPLGRMRLTEAGFGTLANILNQVAREVCQGRIAYFLEGGYDLPALSRSVRTVVETCLSEQRFEILEEQQEEYRRYRDRIWPVFRPYWKL